MFDDLGSTMVILHGNPRKNLMRFMLELRTGDAPVGPSQFSFPGGKRDPVDSETAKQSNITPALACIVREDDEEFHLGFPPQCYRHLVELAHVTRKSPLDVFELIPAAPKTIATTEGAGVGWFTVQDLVGLHRDTIATPDAKFVMTPATLQVYEYLLGQEYFILEKWLQSAA